MSHPLEPSPPKFLLVRKLPGPLVVVNRAGAKLHSIIRRRKDSQVLQEFRTKLRQAEDLISKLAFSLREIQGMRSKKKKNRKEQPTQKPARVIPVVPSSRS